MIGNKVRVALLIGGNSDEREVSLMSAEHVRLHLDPAKYDVITIDINKNNGPEWIGALIAERPDVVLSALHGGTGENGSVQGVLECLNIPYVGSRVLSSAMAMDKATSKLIMRANHIPVADDVFIPRGENLNAYIDHIERLGLPVVVKPNRNGSSVGVSIVKKAEDLEKAFDTVQKLDDDVIVEKYIAGQEVTCGVVETADGIDVLTVLNIDVESEFYDYEAKYLSELTRLELSSLPAFLQTMIQEIAKKVFLILQCNGYGRVDMIVNEEQIYVLEINTLPGLTSHSLMPKAISIKPNGFAEFLDGQIAFAMQRT